MLYGQTGVGKSSFLAAGLLPRLKRDYEILYIRRDQKDSLTITIQKALIHLADDQDGSDGPGHSTVGTPLRVAWRTAEVAVGKPLIILLDQVEEVFTHPNADRPNELAELAQALSEIFTVDGRDFQGKILVSFRKEWFPEVQKIFDLNAVSFGRVFLEALDRDAVIEIVNGLVSTARLQKQYGLTIETHVPEQIADDLLNDRDSPTAPALQILLTKMWEEAAELSSATPAFTESLYLRIKKQGLLLDDFVDRQLAQLAGVYPDLVSSGFVLDLLVYHTTPQMTAAERCRDDLMKMYNNHKQELSGLLEECKNLYLLFESGSKGNSAKRTTRLAHDTLALPIRHKFDESDLPGPRARRILKNRAVEWANDHHGAILDGPDLLVVEQGAMGLGVLMPHEQRLIAASRIEQSRRNRRRTLLHRCLIGAVVGLLFTTGLAGWGRHTAVQESSSDCARKNGRSSCD